jgi:hypothetical protein
VLQFPAQRTPTLIAPIRPAPTLSCVLRKSSAVPAKKCVDLRRPIEKSRTLFHVTVLASVSAIRDRIEMFMDAPLPCRLIAGS